MANLPEARRKSRRLREGNNMIKLENWKEVTKGIYRYVIGANVAYEIHIMTWNHKTKIERICLREKSCFLVCYQLAL